GQVEALAHSLDVLTTAPEPEKFIGQMLSTIGRLLNAHSASLWLFDDSSDALILRSSTSDGGKLVAPDPEHPFIKNPLFWKENAVVQELLFTAGPVVCDDVETDPRVNGDWGEHLKRNGTKRFLAVPLLVGGQVRGFVGIRHVDRASYRPEEIELTQALAHQQSFQFHSIYLRSKASRLPCLKNEIEWRATCTTHSRRVSPEGLSNSRRPRMRRHAASRRGR